MAVALLVLLISCAQTEQPGNADTGVWKPLFNGTNLAGWEAVGNGTWAVEDDEIVVRRPPGERGGGWLVTLRDYEDFKLRLKCKMVSAHSNSGILIRDPGHGKISRPAFNGYEIQLYNQDGGKEKNTTGAIYSLSRSYFEELPAGEWMDIEIHCIGDHVVSFVNGKKMAEAHSRRSFKGAVGLQMHGGAEATHLRWRDIEIMELPPATREFQRMEAQLEQAPGEFTDFLAGRKVEDFDVFWEGGAAWSLQDGVLRGDHPTEISWIFTKESYADFILSMEYRISEKGNAGFCFRLPWPDDPKRETGPASLGYECQIHVDDNINPTGSLYMTARAYEQDDWGRTIHREGAWNTMRIYARGDHIVTYVNNRRCAEVHDTRSLNGRIGFQVHDPAEWVEYRNVQIKVIE